MRIQQIYLQNFRGYDNLALSFENGLNVLFGQNGAGKTNLIEAISFLSLARSFRTNDEKELRKRDTQFSRMKGVFYFGERRFEVEMLLTAKGKKITINGHDVKKLSELVSECHVIVFKPGDAFLFDHAPSERRKLINLEISRQRKEYLTSLTRYEKILEERNQLLKQEAVNETQLDVLTQMLIQEGRTIVTYRARFFTRLDEASKRMEKELTRGEKEFHFEYHPFVSLEDYEEKAKKAFLKARESDLRLRMTTVGPHREDFSCYLNGVEIGSSGSQGEKRLAALLFKLALYEMVEEKNKKPIVILDDVLSELDEEHQKNLLHVVSTFEQVLLTTTEWNKNELATVYEVAEHKVTRRTQNGRRRD